MTAEQLDRLPKVLAEIVELDRKIAIERSAGSPNFAYFRDLLARRRALTAAADQRWGSLKGSPA